MAMTLEPWEHNILGVYNVSPRPFEGPSRHWFDFVANAEGLEGDFLEFGVYRGRSLVATAMLLQERGSDAIAVGFDTFEGFPSYSPLIRKSASNSCSRRDESPMITSKGF